jgi:ParB family chromosome partitioning protein
MATEAEKKIAQPRMLPQELIAVDRIVDDGKNPRLESKEERDSLQELAESIARDGLLQPILVFRDGGKFHLVAGKRRLAAAKSIGWKKIQALIGESLADVDRERKRVVENLRRLNLNKAEEVLAVVQMVELCGGEVELAADQFGSSETWIRDRLYLQKLTTRVRDMLADGRLNLGQAREIAMWGDPRDQVRIAHTVLGEQEKGGPVTREDIRGWHDQEKRPLKTVAWDKAVEFNGKPACDGCEHNTQNNRGLFGIVKKADLEAYCSLPSCYESKVIKSSEELRRQAEKIKARVAEKEISIESASSIEVAREVSPHWMNPEAMQSTIAATMPISTPANIAAKKPDSKAAEKKGPTEKEIRQAAVIKWADEFRPWRAETCQAIVAAVEETGPGHLRISRLILEHAEPMQRHPPYWAPHSIYDFTGARKNATAPEEEGPISPSLSRLLDCVAAGTWARLSEMSAAIAWDEGDLLQDFSGGPYACQALAKAFGVKTPPPPAFDKFLPEALRSPAAAGKSPEGVSDQPRNYAGVVREPTSISLHFDRAGWLSAVKLPTASIEVSLTPADGGFMATVLGSFGQGSAAAKFEIHHANEREVFATKAAAVLAACQLADNWLSRDVIKSHKKDLPKIEQAIQKLRAFMQTITAALEISR